VHFKTVPKDLLEGKSGAAAGVIPAPTAYIKVVLVKKLVVASQRTEVGLHVFSTGLFVHVFCQRQAGALCRVSICAGRFT
jgi:hypothetical protein